MMGKRDAIILGNKRQLLRNGMTTVYKAVMKDKLMAALDKEGIVYQVKRRVRDTPGPCPAAGQRRKYHLTLKPSDCKLVIGYVYNNTIHKEYMMKVAEEASAATGDAAIYEAASRVWDTNLNRDERFEALLWLNDQGLLVDLARIKKMEWVFTYQPALQIPAAEAEMVQPEMQLTSQLPG